MNSVTSYIKLICVVSIVAGVLTAVIPKGKMKGSFISLCAVITVSAMVLPFNGIQADLFDTYEYTKEKSSDSLSKKTQLMEKEIFEGSVARAIENNLKQAGVVASVSVEGESDEVGIVVKKITVTGEFDSETETGIRSFLADDFSEAEIILKEGIDD